MLIYLLRKLATKNGHLYQMIETYFKQLIVYHILQEVVFISLRIIIKPTNFYGIRLKKKNVQKWKNYLKIVNTYLTNIMK